MSTPLNALEIAQRIEALFRYLALQQATEQRGDLFVTVEYRKHGEFIALYGLRPFGSARIGTLYHCKGQGATYEQALIALWQAIVDRDDQAAAGHEVQS